MICACSSTPLHLKQETIEINIILCSEHNWHEKNRFNTHFQHISIHVTATEKKGMGKVEYFKI